MNIWTFLFACTFFLSLIVILILDFGFSSHYLSMKARRWCLFAAGAIKLFLGAFATILWYFAYFWPSSLIIIAVGVWSAYLDFGGAEQMKKLEQLN